MRFGLFSFFLCLCFSTQAQTLYLSNEIQVCTTGYGGFRPRIVLVNDSIPLVSWCRGGASEAIFVSRLADSAFSTPVQVNLANTHPMASVVDGPSVLTHGDTVWVAYMAHVVDEAIVVSRSYNGGQTFVDTTIVYTTINNHVEFPALTQLPSGRLVIGYQMQVGVGGPIYMASSYSNDHGSTWSMPDTVSLVNPGEPCECCPIGIASKGDTVVIAYRNNDLNIRDFYCSISHDGGVSYTLGGPIDTTQWFVASCPLTGIDIAIAGDSVIGSFITRPASFNQSKIGKASLLSGTLGNNVYTHPVSFPQNHTTLCYHNDTLAVVWQDNSSGNQDVYLKFQAANQPLSPPLQITTATGTQQTPHVVYHNGIFHIVWHDQQASRVKYRKAAFSPFTGQINPQEQELVGFWPNPVDQTVEISGPEELSASLFDGSGRLIGNYTRKTELVQSILTQQPGIYILKSGVLKPQRIVKL